MEFTGIEEYPNIFEKEYCEEIIKHFNVMAQREVVRPNHGEASSDDRVVFDWAHTQGQYHYDFSLCDYFYKKIQEVYTAQYMEKYIMLKQSEQHSPKGMSIQRTRPHQGYHSWHAEASDISSSTRVINYMLYLNDVEEGGETEFLYQGKKIIPEQGKVVIFPCGFTFPHRGNPIYKGEKYIITGWYTYDR
jgi:hypothetical protein|tara:strand:+ start:72 stop:641 length:570 start_codon:yes stop_codon:yes gene_type:complete